MPAVLLTPLFAMAADFEPDLGYIDSVFSQISTIISSVLIPLVLALALLLFIWGVIQYFILGADDQEKRETGRAYMLYAIIGLVAIVAVWGIVALVMEILGITRGAAGTAPGIPGA